MTNMNCLEGIRCPACGQEDRFRITALITCLVTDDGSEPVGDHDWDDGSSTHCPECGFDGELKAFRKQVRLPPDPDGLNDDRSDWAGSALARFIEVTGTDEEDAVSDLLADLLHWCDRNNYDFEAALIRGRGHYEEETLGRRPA
jgi:hypothetical protein